MQTSTSPPPRPSEAILTTIKALSERIVKAQAPIRILDAVNWNDEIRQAFLHHKGKRLPPVTPDYYHARPLGFDPDDLRTEFHAIEREITRTLGQLSPLGGMMRRMCREYRLVIRMLEARGTPEFAELAQELYGSPQDVFHAGDPTVADLGAMLEQTVFNLLQLQEMQEEPRALSAQEAVEVLAERLRHSMPGAPVRVMLSDGIMSDAAAGSDYIKLNQEARFNLRDLEILEAHEGWVHVGTTLNGLAQPYCGFLSKGTPTATVTQEGLAVLTEIITLRSNPKRLFKLVNRIRATTLAEAGADFLEVYRYLLERGIEPEESYALVSRVFRGSLPDGKPFTKDLAYIKGFILTYNFIRVAVAKGRIDRLPLLFCGKVVLEDMKTLAELVEQGIVMPPQFIPPPFADLKGLASWLSFGRFIGSLSFDQLEKDYGPLF